MTHIPVGQGNRKGKELMDAIRAESYGEADASISARDNPPPQQNSDSESAPPAQPPKALTAAEKRAEYEADTIKMSEELYQNHPELGESFIRRSMEEYDRNQNNAESTESANPQDSPPSPPPPPPPPQEQEQLIRSDEWFNMDLQAAYRRKYSIGSLTYNFFDDSAERTADYVAGLNITEEQKQDVRSFNLAERLNMDVRNGAITEEDRIYFNNVKTEDYYDYILTDIEQRKKDDTIIAQASFGQQVINGIVGGIFEDPTTYTSVGAGKLGQIMYVTGRHLLKYGKALTAAVGLLIRGAEQEVGRGIARTIGDRTVTAEEAACDVAAFAAVNTVLGGAGYGVSKALKTEWAKAFSNNMRNTEAFHAIEQVGEKIYTYTTTKAGNVKRLMTSPIKDWLYNSPYLQGMNDSWEFINKVTYHLFPGFISKKTAKQAFFKEALASKTLDNGLTVHEEQHLANQTWNSVKIKYESIVKDCLKTEAAEAEKLNADQFHHQVSRIIDNTSIAFSETGAAKITQHVDAPNAYIQKAAETITNHFAEIFGEAHKYKTLPEFVSSIGVQSEHIVLNKQVLEAMNSGINVVEMFANPETSGLIRNLYGLNNTTSIGYLMRIYDKTKVYDNKAELTDLLMKANRLKFAKTTSADKLYQAAEDETSSQLSHILAITSADKTGIANFSFEATAGAVAGRMTKQRTVNIENDVLEKFLVRNPLEIGDKLVHRLTGITSLNKKAINMGYKDWNHLIESAESMRAKEAMQYTNAAISKAFDEDTTKKIQFLKDCTDLILDRYNINDSRLRKIAQGIKTYNLVTDLGEVTLSSIVDMAAVMARTSLGKTIKAMAKQIPFTKGAYERQQMDKIFSISETVLATSRVFDDTYTRPATWSTGAKRFYSKLTLLPYWNDYWKKIIRLSHYDSIIEASINRTERDIKFLSENRISHEMADGIADAFRKHGSKDIFGVHSLDLEDITNKHVKNFITGHLDSTANNIIVSNNKMNLPFWAHSNWANALMSYYKFQFDHFNANVLPLVMQGKYSKLSLYAITSLGLATAVKAVKDTIHGKKTDWEDSGTWWRIIESSGMGGWMFGIPTKVVGAYQNFTYGGGFGDAISRPASTFTDLFKTGHALFQERSMSEKQLRRLGRQLPGFNLFYLTPFTYRGIRKYSYGTYREIDRDSKF